MIESGTGRRTMTIVFSIAAALFLATCVEIVVGAKSLGEGLYRLASPTGIMLLAAANVFAKPLSRTWFVLMAASGVLCAIVLGLTVARFLS